MDVVDHKTKWEEDGKFEHLSSLGQRDSRCQYVWFFHEN